MTLMLDKLIEAIPPEADEADAPTSAHERLLKYVAEIAVRPVPVSRAVRLWILGSVHAKIAAGYLAWWVRNSFASRDEKERRLNETHFAAAVKLLGAMSYLRGVVAKAGQLLAAYPRIVPDEFFQTLSTLHFETPPMHFALIRELMRDELGGNPNDVFAEFDTRAFAAASLGQVHRARLKTGEPVAVKVQYPGIANTIEADFRNMTALLAPMRLTRDWENTREQWADMRRTLLGETDYVQEAAFMERARAEFAPHEGIVIPRSYPDFSSRRVLTMDFLDGVHIDRYLLGNPSQEERDRFGHLIMLASFRIAHKAKLWYADSNPGNYLFLPDGRLGVLDFGCCREFTPDEWSYYKQIWDVYQRGGVGLRDAMIRAVDLDPDGPLDEEHLRFLEDYNRWFSDYMTQDTPFDFGDEAYIRRGVEFMAEIARKRYFRSKPVNIWITRHLLGLKALAYRLKAHINMRRLGLQEAWDLAR